MGKAVQYTDYLHGRVNSTVEFVNRVVKDRQERDYTPFSKYFDNTFVPVTWLKQNSLETTHDGGFDDVYAYSGENSPVRYSLIRDVPLWNVDMTQLAMEDTEYGLDANFESEGDLPIGVFQPLPNDYMILNYSDQGTGKFIIMKITEVRNDTFRIGAEHYYHISFKFDALSSLEERFPNQITEEYQTLFDNIGTEVKPLLRSDKYEKVLIISELYRQLKEYYIETFYDYNYNAFILSQHELLPPPQEDPKPSCPCNCDDCCDDCIPCFSCDNFLLYRSMFACQWCRFYHIYMQVKDTPKDEIPNYALMKSAAIKVRDDIHTMTVQNGYKVEDIIYSKAKYPKFRHVHLTNQRYFPRDFGCDPECDCSACCKHNTCPVCNTSNENDHDDVILDLNDLIYGNGDIETDLIRIYDKYLAEFLIKHELLSDRKDFNSVYLTQEIPKSITFNKEYRKTIYYLIESCDKSQLKNIFYTYLTIPVSNIMSIFYNRAEEIYDMLLVNSDGNKNQTILYQYIDKGFIDAISTGELFPNDSVINMIKNLIIDFINNISINTELCMNIISNLSDLDIFDNSFRLIPLLMYIIQFNLDNILNDKNTLKEAIQNVDVQRNERYECFK